MPNLTYLSLGAGVQSTALLVMSARGMRGCPKADVAIFADTQDEPPWVYETVRWCQLFGDQHGLPVLVTSRGKLSDDMRRAARGEVRYLTNAIPAFTKDAGGRRGMLPRQCTATYKISVLKKAARRFFGYERSVPRGVVIDCLLGISTDEAHRMKDSPVQYVRHVYPLVDAGLSRSDCRDLLAEVGAPEPKRSACVFCPFHGDAYWSWLKNEHPDQFAIAVEYDQTLRNAIERLNGDAFLHKSCVPLDEVDFARWQDPPGQQHMFDADGFGNECEGMCGV